MDNYVLLAYTKELEEKSIKLGFTRVLFLGRDLVVSKATTPKDLLSDCQKAHQQKKKLIYFVPKPELLRFAIEKAPVDLILGIEELYPHDSLHYPKAGMDQVLGPLAKQKKRIVGFSFSSLLHTSHRARMMMRIAFNAKVCKKYGVDMVWSTFAGNPTDLRSVKDLEMLWRFLTTQILK
ncbi:hypothetical protein HYV86_05370 [Candidatus Woesearchaeota archaeon]|nr:hypothetical protein [Candidatus Woesearchaeota archaeon]